MSSSVYCLLMLRNIHSPDDYLHEYELPNLSILLAVLLTLASFGWLIYFIHHIGVGIQAEHILRSLAQDLDHAIDRIFPEHVGREPNPSEREARAQLERMRALPCTSIAARKAGYVKLVEREELLGLACEYDAVLELNHRPGDFAMPGLPLVNVCTERELDEEFFRRLCKAFCWERDARRSRTWKPRYELVEVAVRALSPSLNDPFIAIACIDYLGAALSKLLSKPSLPPSPTRLVKIGLESPSHGRGRQAEDCGPAGERRFGHRGRV